MDEFDKFMEDRLMEKLLRFSDIITNGNYGKVIGNDDTNEEELD